MEHRVVPATHRYLITLSMVHYHQACGVIIQSSSSQDSGQCQSLIVMKYKKPLDDNFFCKIFHIHAFALLYQRLFRRIQPSDMYDLPQSAQPEQLKINYQATKASLPEKNRTLRKVLIHMFKWEIVLGIVMSFVVAFLLLESPLIMKTILEHIEKTQVTPLQTSKVRQYIWIWLGVFFIKIFFNQITDRIFFRVGLKIELLVTTLFIDKVTKVYVGEGEGEADKAVVMNYLMVEIRKIHVFFKKGSWLFSQPPVIILAVVVVFLEGKQFGLLLFQILFVMLILSMLIDSRMQECHHHKHIHSKKRINTSIELLRQHRQLNSLGWGTMIPEASEFYRNEENSLNTKYIFYKRINEILLVIVTYVYFVCVFLLRSTDQTVFRNITLADIFTMTIFIYLLKTPIKNIRYTLGYFYEMMDSFEAIEQFLGREELHKVNVLSHDCDKGMLMCRGILVRPDLTEKEENQEEFQNLKSLVLMKRLSIEDERADIISDLVIDHEIKVMPGDKVSIESDANEGSTFLAVIAGLINQSEGKIIYGGKMTYHSSQMWFMDDTIQANVLIGRPLSQERIKMVYQVTELQEQLNFFLYKERTKITDSLRLSETQKRKIILARTLYTEADIYLMDFPLKGIPQQRAERILSNIKSAFPTQTFLINAITNLKPVLNKTIVFANGMAVQYDESLVVYSNRSLETLETKMVNSQSEIHMSLLDALSKQKQLEKRMEKRGLSALKMKTAVRHLLNVLKVAGKDRINEMIARNENIRSFVEHKYILPSFNPSKPKSTSDILKTLLKRVSFPLVVVVFLIIAFNEGIKLLLNILLGELILQNQASLTASVLRLYIILSVVLLVLEITWGLVESDIAKTISNSLSGDMMRSLSGTPIENIEGKDVYELAEETNRDYEEIFMLTHRGFFSFSNLIVLLNTIGLILYLGLSSLVVLTILMIFNVLFFRHLLITQREVAVLKNSAHNQAYTAVWQLVNGVQTLRHQADLPFFIKKQESYVKTYTVYLMNERFSLHAMKMVSELSTLVMTFWVMRYAVVNRDEVFLEDLPVLFTAIFYCVRLAGLMHLIVDDIGEIDNLLQTNIIPTINIIELPQEQDQSNLSKPDNWPKDNSLTFQNVSVYRPFSNELMVKQLNFEIQSGERVALYGSIDCGMQYLFRLIEKGLSPSKVFQTQSNGRGTITTEGVVSIGKQNLKNINRKHVLQHVFRLSPLPFIMTSTLRTNVDPFNQYRDRDILRMMELVEIRKLIEVYDGDKILEYKIVYEDVSLELKQAINVVRALLKRPAILISQLLDSPTAEKLLSTYLTYSTIIYVNPTVKSLKDCNCQRLMYIWKGVLVQNGDPADILSNKTSVFVRKHLPLLEDRMKETKQKVGKRQKRSNPVEEARLRS